MIASHLLRPQAILISLVAGACLLRLFLAYAPAQPETTGCIYSRSTFNAIRHQARLAHQAGRHDRAQVLDYVAEILRCQPEGLEQRLAHAVKQIMWERPQVDPASDCSHSLEVLDMIVEQAAIAWMSEEYDRAAILVFGADMMRCLPEDYERKAAQAMSEVWNQKGDIP